MFNVGQFFGLLRKKVSRQISGEPMIPVNELAAKFASKFEPRGADVIRGEIDSLTALKSSLLRVESVACGRIDTKVGILTQELARVPNDIAYPRLDLAALVQEERYCKSASAYAPCYAVFSARTPGSFVRASAKRGKATDYQTGQIEVLVTFAQSAQMSVTARLRKALDTKCRSALVGAPPNYESQFGLAAEFGVGVPPDIRTLVSGLLTQTTFDELYFVTAAPSWYMGPPEASVSVEPGRTLLVGQAHNQFWLLKEFDTVALPTF